MSEVTPGLVVVFGGSGFVGGQVVHALARRGWRVRIAARRPDRAWKLMTAGAVGQIHAVRCDVTRADDIAAALRGATAVINLVGILHEGGKRTFQALHVDAARAIADASVAAGVSQFVHMSALGASADSASYYARTKAAGEAAVRAVRPDAIVIRPSVVFGPGDDFLNKFATLSGFAPTLPLIGGGKTLFQPVFVNDVAAALANALSEDAFAGRTFELGGPTQMTFEDILTLIGAETGRRRLLLPLPFPVARIIGALAQLTAIVGLKPVLTADQVRLLQSDNVVSDGAEGLRELGVEPSGLDAIAPSYLWRYRKGGQFAANPVLAEA